MKIIRDNVCIVNFKDLFGDELPNDLIFDKDKYEENDFVVFSEPKDVDYIIHREDIIDYDTVSSISEKELIRKIRKIEKKLEPLYVRFFSTSSESKKELFRDSSFRTNLFKLDKIYYDLLHYKNNRDEEDERVHHVLSENHLAKTIGSP